jgi:hypothetical protein
METNTSTPASLQELEAQWHLRQAYWRRKLGRLRLGVEPIEEQLARYRRVTWVLTAVPSLVGAMIFAIFAAFRRPDIGLKFVAIILLPIVLGSWWDYYRMTAKARRYHREADRYLRERERLGGEVPAAEA